jgi:hypothetical protein
MIFFGLLLVLAGLLGFWAFGPKETKDQSATLKAGDCFENTGTEKAASAHKLDCADPHADYKVLKMDKAGVVDVFSCEGVTGTTGSLTQNGADGSFVVCFENNPAKNKGQ